MSFSSRVQRSRTALILSVGIVVALPSSSGSAMSLTSSALLQRWSMRHAGPTNLGAIPSGIAVSPDGETVYVTGPQDRDGYPRFATIAYDAGSGAQRWEAFYAGGQALALVVAPDGSRIYVTGSLYQGRGFITIAYDAGTGTELWQSTYAGSGEGRQGANAIAVSPDGVRVYVTGESDDGSGLDVATMAYDAADGEQEWVSRFSTAGMRDDIGFDIEVDQKGKRIFVAGGSGFSLDNIGHEDLTIAYEAASGEMTWSALFEGKPERSHDRPVRNELAIDPDGSRVFVTGQALTTIAYRANTGSLLWVSHYGGGSIGGLATGIATAPTGVVYVVGRVDDLFGDLLAVAYGGSNGDEVWSARYRGPWDDMARDVVVSPDGSRVYVTGWSSEPDARWWADYITIAYEGTAGTELWHARFAGPDGHPSNVAFVEYANDHASRIAMTPDGTRLFVTGGSVPSRRVYHEFATVAYCVPEAVLAGC